MTEESLKSVTSKTKGYTITINEEYCKGCTICVEVCPKDTLIMVPIGTRWQGSIAVVRDIETCIGCLLCELQCPDFALEVDIPEKKKKKTVTA